MMAVEEFHNEAREIQQMIFCYLVNLFDWRLQNLGIFNTLKQSFFYYWFLYFNDTILNALHHEIWT